MVADTALDAVDIMNAWDRDVESSKHTCDDGVGFAGQSVIKCSLDNTSSFEDDESEGSVLQRSRTFDLNRHNLSRAPTRNREHANLKNASLQMETSPDYFSERRRFSLQLPSFRSLGISTNYPVLSVQDTEPALTHLSGEGVLQCCTAPSRHGSPVFCSLLPPLTPPPEEMPASNMDYADDITPTGSKVHSCSASGQPSHEGTPRQEADSSRVQPIQLPSSAATAGSTQFQKLPWVARASHKMISILGSACPQDAIQVVSQTLPCQAKDGRSKPTFEAILETLQTDMEKSPYITITHAVPQARVMEELPKTPPSTPNFRNEMSDYFGNDQTIFTHAAVVPIYHSHDRANYALAGKLVHHIAPPCSTQVSILERYIPPTMPEEIQDFFGLSTRSYLSDRLSELSASNGSLLLIYPTSNGGNTFARRYISPVIDPYLRRFVMLNGLTSVAADLMGEMTAIDHMLDFEEMRSRVVSLCQNLNNQPAVRGPRSAFSVTHSEVTTVVLDRSTWLNWYVEQEQSRLRQNLVEYHQEGGRMPESDGNQEVTVGMLTRDFIDGLQRSREPAGGAEIEVGVFLITRSRVQ